MHIGHGEAFDGQLKLMQSWLLRWERLVVKHVVVSSNAQSIRSLHHVGQPFFVSVEPLRSV